MTDSQRRGERGRHKEKRLDPGNAALNQWAREEQMLQRLSMIAAKASFRNVVTLGAQTFSSIDYSVSHFPIKIDDLSIEGHQKERAPNARPLEVPKRRPKFLDTMGDTG